jgi:hypothetical protein
LSRSIAVRRGILSVVQHLNTLLMDKYSSKVHFLTTAGCPIFFLFLLAECTSFLSLLFFSFYFPYAQILQGVRLNGALELQRRLERDFFCSQVPLSGGSLRGYSRLSIFKWLHVVGILNRLRSVAKISINGFRCPSRTRKVHKSRHVSRKLTRWGICYKKHANTNA